MVTERTQGTGSGKGRWEGIRVSFTDQGPALIISGTLVDLGFRMEGGSVTCLF